MSKRDYPRSAIERCEKRAKFRSKRIKENGPGIPWGSRSRSQRKSKQWIS
jgi:hypothetical protein